MKGSGFSGLTGFFRRHWPFLILLVGLTAFQLWGIGKVPFHPDEATYLFMSGDLETLFLNPRTLGFDPEKAKEQEQIYRTIDGPLTRYVLGVGRWAFGLAPLPKDWDWGETWEENQAAGALPSPELLFAGRLAMTLLLSLSLILIYAIVLESGDQLSGWLAVILLGLNALALLHGRRAMAEGALIFGILFALWSFLRGWKYPWLAGLGMAVAYNVKLSAFPLLPVGMLAVIWVPKEINKISTLKGGHPRPIKLRTGLNLIQFFVVFGLVVFLLNPIYWRNPVEAVQASLTNRQDLLTRQVANAERLAPEQVLDTPTKRLAVILGHVYVLPLQFFEVGNYQSHTATTEHAYLAVPGHGFMRGLAGGGVLLAITLVGVVRGVREVWRKGVNQSRSLILLFLATSLMSGALIAAVPLPHQRYSIPLIPLVILWMAKGIGFRGNSRSRK